MNALNPYDQGSPRILDTVAAWLLAMLWASPLVYAMWTAVHTPEFATHFNLAAPLTTANFIKAWNAAPFARYFVNTVLLVTMVLAAQLVLCTLAAYAFAKYDFWGKTVAFALVLMQLMIMPDVLIVENYQTMGAVGILDSTLSIGLPYMASAFGHLPVAPDLQDRAQGARRRRGRGRGQRAADPLARVRAPGPGHVPGLRPGKRELPLEQLPVAAYRHQHP